MNKVMDYILKTGNTCVTFAEKLGVHKSYVYHMTKGSRMPSLQVAKKTVDLITKELNEKVAIEDVFF